MTQAQPADLWYKDAVFYSLNVRSFYDSNGDGTGDLNGLIRKLDYLEDLGVTALLLQPFYPSPLRNDGYDITDQRAIHPEYGNPEQFRRLAEEVHQRQLRLLIDVVVSHTSTDHPWFQRARKAAPGTPERDFYLWSEKPGDTLAAGEREGSLWEWDSVAGAYYAYSSEAYEPDLNFRNDAVRTEFRNTLQHWLDLGVDGFRLLNLPTLPHAAGAPTADPTLVHELLRELRRWQEQYYPGRVLMAEANLWPEQAVRFFGGGDECQLAVNYPLMPRLFMALQTENSYPIIDIIEQTPAIPDRGQWALFLRNHDELSLQMVTEEERSYLLRTLAPDQQARRRRGIARRLAPLLDNDRRKLELLYTLLFSLPGAPILYYGDEIGMGDNIYLADRRGLRTPMQWSDDRNAGFSTANPQQLALPVVRDPLYRFETVNVENQTRNPASLWWWIKNSLAVRKRQRVLSRGSLRFLDTGNGKVLAFLRAVETETMLVLVNLSRHAQAVALDLRAYAGNEPLEVFSQTRFFAIANEPYHFTLGPYGYYWFVLQEEQAPAAETTREGTLAEVRSEAAWGRFFTDYRARRQLERNALPVYLRTCRWFTSKGFKITNLAVRVAPALTVADQVYYLLIIDLRYADGPPETYLLPVAFIRESERIVQFLKREPMSVVCHLETAEGEGLLVDALYVEAFRSELFWLMHQNAAITVGNNRLRFEAGNILNDLDLKHDQIQGQLLRAEQSNTSVIYNGEFFFKIYRKLDTDINPDLELVRFLSERTSFTHSPRYGGGIELEGSGQFTVLGLLQNKIPNQGEAWTFMLRALERYYSRVLAADVPAPPSLQPADHFEAIPEPVRDFIGRDIYDRAALLGQRTAEMHIALASDQEDPDFRPEPFTPNYQRSLYSGYRKLLSEKLGTLARRIDELTGVAAAEGRRVLSRREEIVDTFQQIYSRDIQALKTRVHGDYHLGQVLYDEHDFYIIDFEGEPLLSIAERRLKRTPFKDVAGMIRSFHYAALGQLLLSPDYRRDDLPRLENWGQQWYHYMRGAFLQRYLATVAGQPFLPPSEEEVRLLLRIYTLEKAIYEVGYELNARPDWVRIPLRGVLYALDN